MIAHPTPGDSAGEQAAIHDAPPAEHPAALLAPAGASRCTSAAARGVWRGSLRDGFALDAAARVHSALSQKYREELSYWVAQQHGESQRMFGGPFWDIFRGWQLDRVSELARSLSLQNAPALAEWSRTRTAVEIGPGPFPSISLLPWRRAVAVDALADGYCTEGLIPPDAAHVTFLSASAESIPLPSAIADVFVAENCLDHVDDPDAVLAEARRLLRPDGLLWLLVDLMDFSDCMHPSPFSEPRLRQSLARHGFTVASERLTTDHTSHPKAYGEYRALLRKAA
ncbi:MAG: class I SAM-dependent methyltransferase [Phycisphaerales bacterium]